MSDGRSRPLTGAERRVLRLIQNEYGEANSTDRVFFSDHDEAVLFVQDTSGATILCAVLTNIAEFSAADGLSDSEVIRQYLTPSS